MTLTIPDLLRKALSKNKQKTNKTMFFTLKKSEYFQYFGLWLYDWNLFETILCDHMWKKQFSLFTIILIHSLWSRITLSLNFAIDIQKILAFFLNLISKCPHHLIRVYKCVITACLILSVYDFYIERSTFKINRTKKRFSCSRNP